MLYQGISNHQQAELLKIYYPLDSNAVKKEKVTALCLNISDFSTKRFSQPLIDK
jgi:hypothetical protein